MNLKPYQKPEPELRVVFQASVPIDNIYEGEQIYNRIKKVMLNYSERITMNGQITKNLEPCCRKVPDNDKNTTTP